MRTFDEVYKSIKSKVKEHETKKKEQKNRRKKSNQGSEEEGSEQESYGDEDSDRGPDDLQRQFYNDYGYEEEYADALEGEEILDNQDLDDADREVLNDRILGIINVFSQMQNSNHSKAQFPSKYIKALEELGKKNLSIEKKDGRGAEFDSLNQGDSA